MASPMPLIGVRGSTGVSLYEGDLSSSECRDSSNSCRCIAFSKDGKLFAWNTQEKVYVVSLPSLEKRLEVDLPRTQAMAFSPKGTVLALWQLYTAQKENLHLLDTKDGRTLASFVHKKQSDWQPQWSEDEEICARGVNNEVLVFENNAFEKPSTKLHLQKMSEFSLAPGGKPYHMACLVPGSKGQPSFVRVFCHPHFDGPNAGVANKSFYKADRVDFFWNKKGKGLLLLTSTDVDKTGASYYGDQGLHFLRTTGDTAIVKRNKEGPIYSVAWSPQCDHFCVVYGFMPAKAALFNLNCDLIFEMGTGPRNSVYYNPHGSLLILAGFGNLRGNVEVWDVKAQKLVSKSQASDSTLLEWSPDGEHYLTATTAPRLRVANGMKVWHYTGSLQHEYMWPANEELWDAQWQPGGSFEAKPITYVPVAGIQSSQPQASKQVYRPPGARKEEKQEKPPEVNRERKMKNIKKKLQQITILKEQLQKGVTLEANQLEKLKKEQELLQELQSLKV
ncbi:eukaryotic translation initiation factor 2A-like [Ornithodoros turicata]|uniref:eukaryotic translation initiation factor 2A-like n=1 Tax=Ornithodoros turicata TaxID=34597 RepID=UPI0031389472